MEEPSERADDRSYDDEPYPCHASDVSIWRLVETAAGGLPARANLLWMKDQSLIEEMREAMKGARERAEERREQPHESALLDPEPETRPTLEPGPELAPELAPDPEAEPAPRSILRRLFGR